MGCVELLRYQRLCGWGWKPDFMAYWVVAAGFRSMRNMATMFFNFMVEKERFPTILTVNDLCRNLCRHGKVDELLETFHVLNSQNYFKDVEGFNVMISFLCRAGKVREGYTVLQEMKKKGFQPNVSSYNYIMEACCKEDLLRPARKLWDEMFSNGCLGNLKTLPTAIIGSGRGGRRR
ncbi:pentatricopeptide repeat-containing protein At5g14080-like [Vigna angularis]|uniref:pentatricopeptide repeat-containing protein At5g14080-like n=1 Tax=Phaseolus angularis TaxID=3914 RepID=UPI000809F24A|nr:pentatricopeptide repeat-containing protein At5g14080-like [Vigna angularis]